MKRVDVIVPCYNEEKRVAKVLRVLSASPYIKKIIVVDDASTDDTFNVARRFRSKTEVIKLNKNIGKGGAVKEGLKKVDTETVFLSDADLRGFKEHHVQALINEYFEKHTPVIGMRDKRDNALAKIVHSIFAFNAEGQRVLSKDDLRKVLMSENAEGFGLEAWMNYYFRRKKIEPTLIPLKGATDGRVSRKGTVNIAMEIAEIGETYFEIYKDTLKRALT